MTRQDSLLYVGIPDFAEPTLLLIGDEKSLSWLADQIDTRRAIRLEEMRGIVSQTLITLRLVPVIKNGNLSRLGDAFDWKISAVEVEKFTLQLRELAVATSPAHIYLDPESNAADVQMVASKGEYDPEKIFVSC